MSIGNPSSKPPSSDAPAPTGKPKLAISMGDPGGVGPEVSLKALCDSAVTDVCWPILVGDLRFLDRLARRTGISAMPAGLSDLGKLPKGGIAVLDIGPAPEGLPIGKASEQGGRIAGKAIEVAVDLALSGEVEGIVTAPVSKESFMLAGYGMVGHTELIAGLTNTKTYAMMVIKGRLRVVFATTHLALRTVARKITKRGLLQKLGLAQRYLERYMGIPDARIGVACLNPHCGEGGFLGREEQDIIEPAIQMAKTQGICVEGPFPADSIFRPGIATRFDAVVAMYHDQGMIPLKLGDHDDVVNITIGIPCVRTSPGHGSAFDIAGKGLACEKSMAKAIVECARIAKRLRDAG